MPAAVAHSPILPAIQGPGSARRRTRILRGGAWGEADREEAVPRGRGVRRAGDRRGSHRAGPRRRSGIINPN